MLEFPRQRLDPARTAWHITWGTYGARLHGSAAPTVDKDHNRRGEPFLPRDPGREESVRQIMTGDAVRLTEPQRDFLEESIPAVCERGGWTYRVCAAGSDHVHVLCDVLPHIHGEKVRRLLKRWLGQALDEQWPEARRPRWRAVEGSNRAIHDEGYLNNAFGYLARQRTTPLK
ncbi:MAG: hypothetical protein KF847_10795 [Pirellulales bacterium]|nr:hypothetical protein [Pirellulales bacterium]